MNQYDQIKNAISRDSSEPLYIQLKEFMKRAILAGDFKSGECIPSERDLCHQLGISHITVRQALNELTLEGFLTRKPGKGTFVGGVGSNHGGMIGLVIPDGGSPISSYFLTGLIFGAKRELRQAGCGLCIYTETETDYLKQETRANLKGVILTDPQLRDARINILREQKFPFTIIGKPQQPEVSFVDNDNIDGCRKLTAATLHGAASAALLNGPAHWTVCQDREEGFRQACGEIGCKELVFYGRFDELSGVTEGLRALERGAKVLICADDRIALGALRAIQENGLRIPDDIRVACCNNPEFAEVISPTLTTLEIFPEEVGRAAVRKVLEQQTGTLKEPVTFIRTEVIERTSSQVRVMIS